MRLSKKQRAIIGIVREQEILEKRVLFEALEGVLEEKKKYRSRYDSFVQTIKKLVEKGVLEWREEHLVLTSRHKQKTINRTLRVWRVLKQLRQQQQPLTLANLKTKMDIREWIGVLAEWKLTLPGSDQHRLIDLDAILDNNPREIEALLRRMQVDIEKITASGLIFSVNHHHQLQQGVHRCFCKKIQQFSLPQQKLEALIEAKLPHQASGKTIRELLEPITQLSCQEQQQIANSFENPFLRKTAAERLCSMIQSQRPFKSRLQQRFPGFFEGHWEWERLYQQLKQKISAHAKSCGMYQSPEEWKHSLKQRARHRFQKAQRSPQYDAPLASIYTCYHMLGLQETNNIDEIRTAFRKLAKAHHPDQGGSPEFFRNLNQAYTRLVSYLEN